MSANDFCCEYWSIGEGEVNRFILTEQARNPANQYKGKPFVYCPWCGSKLSEPEYHGVKQKLATGVYVSGNGRTA